MGKEETQATKPGGKIVSHEQTAQERPEEANKNPKQAQRKFILLYQKYVVCDGCDMIL